MSLRGHKVSADDLANLVNHIVLPPKLPQREDLDLAAVNRNLLCLLQDVTAALTSRVGAVLKPVTKMLSALDATGQTDKLRDGLLQAQLSALEVGDCFAVHLSPQNSAILFLRKDPELIVIETFEISASNNSVMSTRGRLVRSFPGRSVACPSTTFYDNAFSVQLRLALKRLANERPPEVYNPTARKAGDTLHEGRDTTHPGFVNDYLMTILSVVGDNYPSSTVQKCVRDDVLWKDTLHPWRRSPFWLFLRVALLRTLHISLEPEQAMKHYKLIMLNVVARLLQLACAGACNPETLSLIQAKLARRSLKFEQTYGCNTCLDPMVLSKQGRVALDTIWMEQTKAYSTIERLPIAGWEDSTSIMLSSARPYLAQALNPLPISSSISSFSSKSPLRLTQASDEIPSLKDSQVKSLTGLIDTETWVEKNLNLWTSTALKRTVHSDCEKLADLITDYWTLVSFEYQCSPMEKSCALLVVLELWVALDKICAANLPMLLDYPPEIPSNILNFLLLPKAHQMSRLHLVEAHIQNRWSKVIHQDRGLFNTPTELSLCNRFYDQSPALQKLRADIDQSDAERRVLKEQELARKMQTHIRLIAESEAIEDCDMFWTRRGYHVHDRDCTKCGKMEEATAMEIKCVEESLPNDEIRLKTTVFELAMPKHVAVWRDTTWFVINDIGRRGRTRSSGMHTVVHDYPQLKPYVTRRSRITLGSSTKAHIACHYSTLNLPTTFQELCRHNGLTYSLWDSDQQEWLNWPEEHPNFRGYCTFDLPQGPYAKLDWALDTTTHTTNEVMSRQNECDLRLEKGEFIAFCNLRAGERIQWTNILRELGCSNLDHTNPAVATLILQAAWQAGTPSNDLLREAHTDFRDLQFCTRLLSLLRHRLIAIENNWDKQYSMMILIQLGLRLLSLSSDVKIERACLNLLRDARKVALDWCNQLSGQVHRSQDHADIQSIGLERLLHAALLCYSTFDVDEKHMSRFLASADDLAVAAEAQAIVCDSTPANRESLPLLLQQTLLHHSKICHKLEPYVRQLLKLHGSGLNSAISRIWHGANLGPSWTVALGNAEAWVCNTTICRDASRSQSIHFNLLGGDLLVDAKPVGKIPDNIRTHPLFLQIFGSSILQVFASDMPGMECRISQQIEGNEIHLGLRGSQAIIKARVNDRVLQALPRSIFEGSLPSHFVNSYHHWIDEATGDIEFRSLDRPWQTDRNNWKMSFSSLDFRTATAYLRLGSRRLIENESAVGRSVTNVLRVLDRASNCHITFDEASPSFLEIDMPRFNLHFMITQEGELLSVEFNAVVDRNQTIDTLVGLQNKLVLRSVGPSGCPQERQIIVPYGEVVTCRTKAHVSVSIKQTGGAKQRHFIYSVDRHLRKLRGAQDTLGLLYKAYLHAVTSFCLSDPFTGHTGVEEAISILREASLFTSNTLKSEEIQILQAIANLTPRREFYPENLRVMQKVTWNENLPCLSQHDDFLPAVKAILEHHKVCEKAQSKNNSLSISRGDQHLLERARKRNISVVRSGLVSHIMLSKDDDGAYTDRGAFESNDRSQKVHEIASLSKQWPSRLLISTNLAETFTQWQEVRGYCTPFAHDLMTINQLTTIQLRSHWGSLYGLCRSARRDHMMYPLIFTFCAMAHGMQAEGLSQIRTLLAIAFSGAFINLDPPASHDSYNLKNGSSVSLRDITQAVRRTLTKPDFPHNATQEQSEQYQKQMKKINNQVEQICQQIVNQWPAEQPVQPKVSCSNICMPVAMAACSKLFTEWHKNRRFLLHVASVNDQLKTIQASKVAYPMPTACLGDLVQNQVSLQMPSLDQLLSQPCPVELTQFRVTGASVPITFRPDNIAADDDHLIPLAQLIIQISSGKTFTHQSYASGLRSSLNTLRQLPLNLMSQDLLLDNKDFESHHSATFALVHTLFEHICRALAPSSNAESILMAADLWPRTLERDLLGTLAASNISELHHTWRDVLLHWAEAIASLQRSERILKFILKREDRNLRKELETPGREGWSANEIPNWLLLEIENNITIRPLQAKIAKEMMRPSSDTNSLLQLNMGEGKSSVIVPVLATALADGQKLVRIVVLKSLLRQTEQVLSGRLGGLLNQRVCHIPFSRKTQINTEVIGGISRVIDDYRKHRGVMVVLPEEISSMKLMSRERMTCSPHLAASILNLGRTLSSVCRDIIDESDEILGIKSQLIYPVGSQQMLDGKTDRWLVAQGVLHQVMLRGQDLASRYPSQLHVDMNGKFFPVLKFLNPKIFDTLLHGLVNDAIDGQVAGISFDYFSSEIRRIIKKFIKSRNVSDEELNVLTENCTDTPQWNAILILRGLFAHDVLSFVLQRKRWLVEYGLDLSRCSMAVPYRAKGIPAQNSEFGHPDVAVLLTCLSYYYTGLTMAQVEDCFRLLLKDTNAEDIYRGWAAAGKLPRNLSSLDAINLDDRALCQGSLFPRMQFSLETINFYLNQVVFPKEGKEFAKRLSASGWDIPSASPSSGLWTTGFSGTNDSRVVLPHSIQQRDLLELQHTNAMVLNLILRQENRQYIHASGLSGKKLTVEELLSLICKQDRVINVLIDVGAQVLEATNVQLAQIWLAFRPDAKAAIYFDDKDEAMVLDCSGAKTPLRISPFSGKLDECLIYMDEVHTRGIDLAIPMGSHAAVTLGPRLVKDRLVQACMRLRYLGNGHSLCFVSPTEVHASMCDLMGYTDTNGFTSFEVLAWCMEQTCQALEIARPLRAMHGLEYVRQQKVVRKFFPTRFTASSVVGNKTRMKRFWQEIQEDESRSLELLYGVHEERIGAFKRLLDRDSKDPMMQHLVAEYDSLNKTLLEDCTVDNEQERELAHEVERQQQIERPKRAQPWSHKITPEISHYVRTGAIADLKKCKWVTKAFNDFKNTSAWRLKDNQAVNPNVFQLLVSGDFAHTVKVPETSLADDYLRSVNWVLSSKDGKHLVVISPHEANELLPQIRASKKVRLHTFAPRLNKAMASFNDMNFYTVNSTPDDKPCSPSAVRDLNLFAGSLYLENESEYESLRHFLGLVSQTRRAGEISVASDGFVAPNIRQTIGWPEYCPFNNSPLPFLKGVYTLRRNGQGFAQTHMGHLLEGRALRKGAFDGCGVQEDESQQDDGLEEMDLD